MYDSELGSGGIAYLGGRGRTPGIKSSHVESRCRLNELTEGVISRVSKGLYARAG